MITRKDLWPLVSIAFIIAVTCAWWGLALWSLPGAPEWLERARSVCFNITESGLPDAKGWLLLVGQPPAMVALLLVGWGREVRASARRLASTPTGVAVSVMIGATLVAALSLTVARVADARIPPVSLGGDEPAPETYPRLDRPWPEAEGLVDQTGSPFRLERLDGQGAFVTFAFGHCATICPVVVHQAREVRRATGLDLPVVVITLDPWRDTPRRLPALVDQFELDPTMDFMVGGSVDAVNAALDGWNVPRQRDLTTGDVIHPAIVYMVERDGTVAYASTGGIAQMTSLAERLR
jgi:cytochrome oxidase Cu insertion factor (SCO1/SenC/PrrC family)